MIVLRNKNFSDDSKITAKLNKLGGAIKNKAVGVKNWGKDTYDFAKTHTLKENAEQLKNKTIIAGKKVGKYIKEHPDEAAVGVASYTLQPYLFKKGAKNLGLGKKASNLMAGVGAAFPTAELYIAGKVAARAMKKSKDKENENSKN